MSDEMEKPPVSLLELFLRAAEAEYVPQGIVTYPLPDAPPSPAAPPR